MNKSVKRIYTLISRNIKEIIRDPLSLIFIILLPLAMEILFYYLFSNLTDQFQMQYLAPGIIVFSQSFLSLFAGILISTDRGSSFLERLYTTQAKSFEFIISYIISIIPIALLQAVLFYLVGGLIDNSIFRISIIFSILLSIFTSLFYIAAGVLFGSLCNEKSVGGVTSILISCQSLLSGMWFPVEGLSGGIIKIMNILPFKNTTLLVKNSLIGINNIYSDFLIPIIIVFICIVITFIIAAWVFKNKMKSK